MPFKLEGPYGVLQHVEHLINTKGSAVVSVAEGAGQVSEIHPKAKYLYIISLQFHLSSFFYTLCNNLVKLLVWLCDAKSSIGF